MASTGFILPGAAQTISETPWLDDTWTNVVNIYGAGVASITAASYDAGDQSYVLKAYTFNLAAIPDGATINGIEVRINARYAAGTASIDLVQLLDTARARVGTNKAATPQAVTGSLASYTFGTSTDQWGNALTPAWVKDVDFGVGVGMIANSANTDVEIDYIEINVHYTPPSATEEAATAAKNIECGGRVGACGGRESSDRGGTQRNGCGAPGCR